MLEYMISGFSELMSITNFIFINFGLLIGIIFGAIPGLTVLLCVVLFTPLTFGLEPITAMLMLLGMYVGGIYGGSITAILIKTPGTAAAAATMLDGYPLAQQGKAKKALDMALVASAIAGIISACILLFAAPQIAKVTLLFGPSEYFVLAVFGLSIIAGVSGENIVKGIIAGAIGFFISTLGMDETSGVMRFTFGNFQLLGGVQLVIGLIGFFALSELFLKSTIHKIEDEGLDLKEDSKLTAKDLKSNLVNIIRSSLIGTGIGAIPGAGAGISSFLSYNEAKKASKEPEKFGKGSIEAVAAAEAGNNGVTGATLIPLFTLGIPGDATAAVLLGALMMHGLIPGPSLFEEQGNIVYAIMIGLIITNIFLFLQGKFLLKYFAKVSQVPYELLVPIISIFCMAGAFSVNNTTFDIKLIIIFGIVSYFLQRLEFSQIPILLGIVLGPLAESNFRRAMVISEGSYSIFITRPISLFFVLLTLGTLVTFIIKSRKSKKVIPDA